MSHPHARRPALAVVCLIVGLAAGAAGVAAASWIGADDWLDYRSTVANPNGERIVRTGYGVLDFGLPSRVSASTEGEVFVGVAHAVDVDDYLAGLTLSQVDHVDPVQVGLTAVPGTSSTPPSAPAALGSWRVSSQGAGVQQVSGDFTAEPVQAVVIALGPNPEPIVWTLSVHLAGGYLAAWTLAAAGVVLIALALWWLRRSARMPGATGSESGAPVEQRGPGEVARTLTVASLAGALVLAGCGMATSARPGLPNRSDLTKPVPTLTEASALHAELDQRLNAARESQAWPANSTSRQEAAFAEPSLGVARANLEWSRLTKDKWKPEALAIAVHGVLGQPAAAYPITMAAIVELRSKKAPNPTRRFLHIYVREHSYTPWRLAGELGGSEDQMPLTGAGAPTSVQASEAERLARLLVDQVVDGDRSGPVRLPKAFWTYRKDALKAERRQSLRWTKPTAEPALVYTTAATDGPLVYVAFVVRAVYTGKPGPLHWVPPSDSYHRCYGEHSTLSDDLLLEFAIRVRGDRPEIELWDASDYLGEHPGC